MKAWPLLAALLAVGCAASRLPRDSAAPGPRTLLDGVYSAEQSRRGETIYFSTCVKCHRPEMTGSQIVPALLGEAFLERWRRKSVGDLFEKARSMPPVPIPVRPTPGEYADVVAYILGRNAFPAGPQELVADFEALASIRLGD